MGPDIERIIALQSLDQRLIRLKKEIAALPKYISDIEKQLDSHKRRLERDRAALAANESERRTRDGEISGHEEKISKLKAQMLSAKTNDQYTAFQHEIDFCEQAVAKAEDRILELMEAAEPLSKAVQEATAALEREEEQVAREKKAVQKRAAADENELKQGMKERQKLAAEISPKLFSVYERIRKRRGYPVLSEAVQGKCSACNIAIRPQYLQELRRASEPKLCESCGRLLYYHPTIDVEAGQPAGHEDGTRVDMSPNPAK